MKRTMLGGLALIAGALAVPAAAQTKPVEVRIDATETSAPVSPYVYGMFIEPIGQLMTRTLWAEMIDDRKFFAPVLSAEADPDAVPRRGGPPGLGARKWRPVGGDNAVVMDTANPFTGNHSPSVTVGAEPRGFAQTGLALLQGRQYTGSLWVAGDPTAKVEVALVWGDAPAQRLVVASPSSTSEWTQSKYEFSAPATADNVRFEITGTGSGAFRVDAVSLMPADNINGWRADSTALARTLNSGLWRMPGGNSLSDWDWHDALGPRDQRRPWYDHAFGAIHANDLGMDEWLELARLVGVEPYVTVNAGLGDGNSAAELVEYLNGSADTHWGGKRAANGHPEPYGIKYWNIGNEPYGDWQIGKTTRDFYMLKHKDFAERMKRADPSIVLIGSGAMPDQIDPPGPKINPTLDDIRERFGTDAYDWTFGLFKDARGYFSGVTEHWYDRSEERPGAPADVELNEWTRSPANQMRAKALQWDLYRERFPWIDDEKIFLWIDEYAYTGGGGTNLKSALAYGMVLSEMLRHSDFMTAGAFTTGASTMDITPHGAVLNSTGLVFKLYGEHFGAGTVPVEVTGNSPIPKPQYDMGGEHPLTIAGSETFPLDVIAGLSPDGSTLKIAVVNATFDSHPLALTLGGIAPAGRGRAWVLTGPSLTAANRVGTPAQVTISEKAGVNWNRASAAPLSITIFEFPVRGRKPSKT